MHGASINKRLFKHGEAHRSLPLPPCFPISPVLPAVFSKHIPVGKQPPGGLGLSEGAYICLAGICLWIRDHLMHITPDKQERMESGSSVWHQHFFCPTASFFWETPAGSHFVSDCAAALPRAEMPQILLDWSEFEHFLNLLPLEQYYNEVILLKAQTGIWKRRNIKNEWELQFMRFAPFHGNTCQSKF